MGPRAAGGAGAPSSRTPPHPASKPHEAAPRSNPRALLSTQLRITFYCADDGRGRRVPDCRKPQPSPLRWTASSNPWCWLPYRHRSRSPTSVRPSRSLRRPAWSPATSKHREQDTEQDTELVGQAGTTTTMHPQTCRSEPLWGTLRRARQGLRRLWVRAPRGPRTRSSEPNNCCHSRMRMQYPASRVRKRCPGT